MGVRYVVKDVGLIDAVECYLADSLRLDELSGIIYETVEREQAFKFDNLAGARDVARAMNANEPIRSRPWRVFRLVSRGC